MQCEIKSQIIADNNNVLVKMEENKIIGYWITERKKQKLSWNDFQKLCAKEGYILKAVNYFLKSKFYLKFISFIFSTR